MSDGLKSLADGAAALRVRAGKLGETPANAEPRQWMLYELAWCNRLQADVENDAARQKLQREAADKVRSNLARQAGSEGVPVLAAAQIPASVVPVGVAEKRRARTTSRSSRPPPRRRWRHRHATSWRMR